MKKFIHSIKKLIARWKAEKELDKAVTKAVRMYEANHKRYYVIPDTHHMLRVFSWSELKQMKKRGMFSAKVKEPDFIRECFYYTPSRFGNDGINREKKVQKRKAWLTYYTAYRM